MSAIISRTASNQYYNVLVGDSKASGTSLSESTGLRLHVTSVEIDWPIFALASGLKQFAKASCGSPGCLTCW